MRNQVKAAIYTKLAADSTLTALLSGTAAIYHRVAPQGADAPYIVFNQQAGTPSYTMGQRAWDELLYQVKGVTQDSSSVVAGSIADRIDTVLTDQPLSVTGGSAFYVRRSSDVDYAEVDRGEVYNHEGGLYRLYVS